MVPEGNDREIRGMILEELAYVQGRTHEEIADQFAGADDLEIDSKQGQTVAIVIEERLNLDGLIRPEDQTPQTLTSVRSLERLIRDRIRDFDGGKA